MDHGLPPKNLELHHLGDREPRKGFEAEKWHGLLSKRLLARRMYGKAETAETGKVRDCCNHPRGVNSFERHPGDKISRTWRLRWR